MKLDPSFHLFLKIAIFNASIRKVIKISPIFQESNLKL